MILLYLTLNKKVYPSSLKNDHLLNLLAAFKLSIMHIKLVMQTAMAELVPEVLEEEFNNFKTSVLEENQLKEVDNLMSNPLTMLQQINDRQINRKVPAELSYCKKAIEILSNKIKIFLTLRHLVGLLGGDTIGADGG